MTKDRPDSMVLRADNGTKVTVRLEVNTKARRLILRLDERRREAVAVAPSKRKLGEAASFAADRIDWIAARLAELPDIVRLEPGAIFPLRGRDCLISLEGPGRRAALELSSTGGPDVLRVPGDEETAPRRVERYLRKAAAEDLEAAVARHAERLGVTIRKISVKDTRSRWGSCTSDGRLSFSWRLVFAPAAALDYVAAHECAHLLEMNHSPAFWAHVAHCCPDWKRERNWLRNQGRALHTIGGV